MRATLLRSARLLVVLALALVPLGCEAPSSSAAASEAEPSPSSTTAPATTAAAPAAEVRYVVASMAFLRAAPSTEAEKVGRLSINTRLEVLEKSPDGSFVRVKRDDGTPAWVGASLLDGEPLTFETARRRSIDARELPEQVSWLERAATLNGEDTRTLRDLARAYQEAGKPDEATAVRRSLARAERALAKRTLEAGRVYLAAGQDRSAFVWLGGALEVQERVELPREEWPEVGVVADGTWWVLPARGAAVQAHVSKVTWRAISECSDEGGGAEVELELAEALPEGDVAVAASRGPAPAGWSKALIPPLTEEEAHAKAVEHMKAKGETEEGAELNFAPSPRGWHVSWSKRVEEENPSDFGPPALDTHLFVDAEGKVTQVSQETVENPDFADHLVVERVIEQDLEEVWKGCQDSMRREGKTVRSTPYGCCM